MTDTSKTWYMAECTDRSANKGQWLVCQAVDRNEANNILYEKEKEAKKEGYSPTIETIFEGVSAEAVTSAEKGDARWYEVSRTGTCILDVFQNPCDWLDATEDKDATS